MARLSRGKKVLFASVLGLVGLASVEATARALAPAPLEWLERPSRILRADGERGWSLRPGAEDFTVDKPAAINADGFRDRAYPLERPAGVRRIACVGDSYTYGWGVALEDSYPKQLEQALPRSEVLNLGCFGYNARQALATLRGTGLKYRPDVVVYGFYWDDLLPAKVTGEVPRETEPGLLRRALRRSRAAFLAVNRARALSHVLAPPRTRFFETWRALGAGEEDPIRDLWAAQERTLVELREAAASVGGRVVVAVWPLETEVLRGAERSWFEERARRACERAAVPCVLLRGALRSIVDEGLDPYLPYEQHPTPEGYRRAVRVLAPEVERALSAS